MYRWVDGSLLEVLIGHPGGPLHADLDEGDWSIPKGLIDEGEEPFEAARREFTEETGLEAPEKAMPLGRVRQKSGKTVEAWAFEGDVERGWKVSSNEFDLEWPPGSGTVRKFPEIDRADFFDIDEARRKLNPAQVEFLDRLILKLGRHMTG